MFRIGEFSKIAQTPITQLRYYDRIGLFQPEHTDPTSGYRYYRAAQLPALHRILALKELGLALDQIKRLVEDDVSPDEIRGMLSLKKAQVEQELHTQMDRLRFIEARLRQVEQDGSLAPDAIVMRELSAQPVFTFTTVFKDVRKAIGLRMELSEKVPPSVPPKALSHFIAILHGDAFDLQDSHVEMGFMANQMIETPFQFGEGNALEMNILPPITAACVARVGGFENGFDSYGNVGRWIADNNYAIAGPIREVFIVQAPLERINEMVCEIQVPVVPIGAHNIN